MSAKKKEILKTQEHNKEINLNFEKDNATTIENKEKNIFMKYNQPLVQFVPLTERPVKLRVHLVSSQEYDKIGLSFVSFNRNYYKMTSAAKNSSICPFSHPER